MIVLIVFKKNIVITTVYRKMMKTSLFKVTKPKQDKCQVWKNKDEMTELVV